MQSTLLIVRSVANKEYNKGHRAVYFGVVSSVTSILQHSDSKYHPTKVLTQELP